MCSGVGWVGWVSVIHKRIRNCCWRVGEAVAAAPSLPGARTEHSISADYTPGPAQMEHMEPSVWTQGILQTAGGGQAWRWPW